MKKKLTGICVPGQNGDVGLSMCVLKYKDILFPNSDIVWFCKGPKADMLKYNDAISEIRWFPEGWQLPDRVIQENANLKPGEEPWYDMHRLKNENNRLNQELKHEYKGTSDLSECLFLAPWMCEVTSRFRQDICYTDIARLIVGADPNLEWHPYIGYHEHEKEQIRDFCLSLPHKKTVMIENFLGSGPSGWTDEMTRGVMLRCRNKWGAVNFLFASNNDCSKFQDDKGVVSLKDFSPRVAGLANDYSDLFLGVSSGISVSSSAWGLKPTVKIQFCGSYISSTVNIANGPIHLITTDPMGTNPPDHEKRFPTQKNARQVFLNTVVDVIHQM